MNNNSVVWFEIYVQDLDRAKRFYESVLQVTLLKLDAPFPGIELWAFPADKNSYGASGALVKMDGFPSGGNSTLVYFHCEDCAVEESRVADSGGQVHRAKMAIGEYGHIVLAQDTEGNMIGLHSMR
jgi:predicted enzyme related to lactoylglutathione lyase